MNNKYLLISQLSGTDFQEEEVWTNHWKVGTFEQLGTCWLESEIDLKQTITDSLECEYDLENEDEKKKFETELEETLKRKWICHRREKELELFEPTTILSIEYTPNDVTTISIEYLVIRLN